MLEFSVPHLYKNVSLPYHPDDPGWARVTTLAQSPNLHYVRSIEIGSHAIACVKFCRQFHQLVTRLPPHTLTRFSFGHYGRPEPCDLLYLWASQSNLQEMQFSFWINSPSMHDLVTTEQAVLRNLRYLTKLGINLGSEAEPNLGRQFLQSIDTTNLHDVEVDCLFGRSSTVLEMPEAGVDYLFDWLPHHLTRLSLSQVKFPERENWHLSNYHSLHRLRLTDCQDIAPILDDVQTPQVRHLLGRFDEDGKQNDLAAYINFVERAKRLETLVIDNKLSSPLCAAVASALSSHPRGLDTFMTDSCPWLSPRTATWFNKLDRTTLKQLAIRVGESPNTISPTGECEVCIFRCTDGSTFS